MSLFNVICLENVKQTVIYYNEINLNLRKNNDE